jgi:hypothetical protein
MASPTVSRMITNCHGKKCLQIVTTLRPSCQALRSSRCRSPADRCGPVSTSFMTPHGPSVRGRRNASSNCREGRWGVTNGTPALFLPKDWTTCLTPRVGRAGLRGVKIAAHGSWTFGAFLPAADAIMSTCDISFVSCETVCSPSIVETANRFERKMTGTTVLEHQNIGPITGVRASVLVSQYLGIQYASLEDRFSRGKLVECYTGPVDATQIGCPPTSRRVRGLVRLR